MSKTVAVFFVALFSVLLILLSKVFTTAPPALNLVNPLVVVRLQSIEIGDSLPLEISGRWQLRNSADDTVLVERDNFQGNLLCDISGPRFGSYASNNHDSVYLHCQSPESLRLNYFTYPGDLLIEVEYDDLRQRSRLNLFLRLELEDYVLGVVCGELPSQSPGIEAALEAQAIAARTYAIYKIQQGKRLRGDSRDQVYKGSDYHTEQARAAVAETRGMVLSENKKILLSFFHRNCGGATSNSFDSEFSATPVAALVGSEDKLCDDVYQRWQRTVDVKLLDKLSTEFGLGDSLLALNTVSKDKTQRRLQMRLQGLTGHQNVTGEFVRARLGLPSMIWHELVINPDGSITITGSGYGHGIGFCQEGAMRRAKQGVDYATILQHYYPGANVEVLTANLFNQ
ncbi:MAG: SpoIID/LytB domain-containing protein [Planctomycetes bacterium]|nr:SpoIID/LytB domain-containing protein [Planctomycetota bacterium]